MSEEKASVKQYSIETSLTLDYRKSKWGLERLVLDGVSNHLPDDSKSTLVSVKLKQSGEYYDLQIVDPTKPVEEIIFEDNGQGYNAQLLSVLFSTKSADERSVGQFGEGLKLVAATALRESVYIEYQSRNWTAKPYAKHETIATTELDRLCFAITENGHNIHGSRTVIRNPSQKVIDEARKIDGPALITFKVDPDEHVYPMVPPNTPLGDQALCDEDLLKDKTEKYDEEDLLQGHT